MNSPVDSFAWSLYNDSNVYLELEFNDYCNWYNKSRLNGTLGYVSPEEYKNNYRHCV